MTVRQIAEITGKSIFTIHRAIKKRFPGKEIISGIPIDLSELESYLILKQLHPGYDLSLLSQDKQVPLQNAKLPLQNAKLPNGSQMRELRLLVKEAIISAEQVQKLLGLFPSSPTITPPALMLSEQISKEEEGARVWARNIINKRNQKKEDERSQNKLNFTN